MKNRIRRRGSKIITLFTAALLTLWTAVDVSATKKPNWFTDTNSSWLIYKGGYGRISAFKPDISLPLDLAWKKKDTRSIGQTPCAADSFIFVATRDRRLICFERFSGRQIFSRTFRGAVAGTVLIQNLRFHFQTDLPDGKVYVTDINSKHRQIDRQIGAASTGPILEQNQLFLFSRTGKVTCMNSETGYRDWHVQLEGVIEFAPVFLDPNLYVPTIKGVVYKLDALSGKEVARIDLHQTLLGDLCSDEENLYLTLSDGRVVCVSTGNMEKTWEVRTEQHFFCGPAVEDGKIYLASREGYLIKLSAKDGSVEWKTRLEGVSVSTPSVAGKYIFTATKSGEMAAFERETGERLWQCKVTEGISASPLVIGEYVYYCTDRGTVYAFHPKES